MLVILFHQGIDPAEAEGDVQCLRIIDRCDAGIFLEETQPDAGGFGVIFLQPGFECSGCLEGFDWEFGFRRPANGHDWKGYKKKGPSEVPREVRQDCDM